MQIFERGVETRKPQLRRAAQGPNQPEQYEGSDTIAKPGMNKAHFRRIISGQYAQREEAVKNTDSVHDGHRDVPLNRKQPKRPFGPASNDLDQAPPC
jgi:hypothetical protein